MFSKFFRFYLPLMFIFQFILSLVAWFIYVIQQRDAYGYFEFCLLVTIQWGCVYALIMFSVMMANAIVQQENDLERSTHNKKNNYL